MRNRRPGSTPGSPFIICRRTTLERRNACADRKSTRLNSSHLVISYAVFCLKKKNENVLGDLLKVYAAEAKKPDIQASWQSNADLRASNTLSYRKNNEVILPTFAIQHLFHGM